MDMVNTVQRRIEIQGYGSDIQGYGVEIQGLSVLYWWSIEIQGYDT